MCVFICIYVWVYTCTCINIFSTKYIPFNSYNITCMFIFRDGHLAMDNLLVSSSPSTLACHCVIIVQLSLLGALLLARYKGSTFLLDRYRRSLFRG